jgi:hypothetical protein
MYNVSTNIFRTVKQGALKPVHYFYSASFL